MLIAEVSVTWVGLRWNIFSIYPDWSDGFDRNLISQWSSHLISLVGRCSCSWWTKLLVILLANWSDLFNTQSSAPKDVALSYGIKNYQKRNNNSPDAHGLPCPSCTHWPCPPSGRGTGREDPLRTQSLFQWQIWKKRRGKVMYFHRKLFQHCQCIFCFWNVVNICTTVDVFLLTNSFILVLVLMYFCWHIASEFVPKELFWHRSVQTVVEDVFSGERNFQECQRHKSRMFGNCREWKV